MNFRIRCPKFPWGRGSGGSDNGMFLFLIIFTGACLRPIMPRPITSNETMSVKFVDDCSVAASVNLKKSLTPITDMLPQPLTYQQRTRHAIMDQENILQYEMDNFYEFTKKSDLIINEKKSEVMVFNFSKSYAFPPNLTIGKSDIIREVTVTKLLGVKIQSDLRWQENTNYICKRATGKLWVLRRL